MRRISTWVAIPVMATLLLGCAGAVPWNPQGYSGITKAVVEVGVLKPGETPFIKSVTFTDGKEKQSIKLIVELVGGKPKLTYVAAGVLAFDGQKLRAAVEKAISRDVREASPAIVDTIMSAIKTSLGVP